MLHCKFSVDYNSERMFKIGQYLTKLCVEHLGLTFLAHPVQCTVTVIVNQVLIVMRQSVCGVIRGQVWVVQKMLNLRNDGSFVLLVHLVPEVLHFMYFFENGGQPPSRI